MAIRELPVDRLDEVRELRLALHGHHGALPGPPGYALRAADDAWRDWRATAAESLTTDTGAVLVHEADDGTPDGLAYVVVLPDAARPILEPTGPHGELKVLVVADGARGRGIGEALNAEAARWLRARGVIAMHTAVRSTNEDARRFYARTGAVDYYVVTVTDLTGATDHELTHAPWAG